MSSLLDYTPQIMIGLALLYYFIDIIYNYFPLKPRFYQNTYNRYIEVQLLRRYNSELISRLPKLKYFNKEQDEL